MQREGSRRGMLRWNYIDSEQELDLYFITLQIISFIIKNAAGCESLEHFFFEIWTEIAFF